MCTSWTRACYACVIDTLCICYKYVIHTIVLLKTRDVYFIDTRLLPARYEYALHMSYIRYRHGRYVIDTRCILYRQELALLTLSTSFLHIIIGTLQTRPIWYKYAVLPLSARACCVDAIGAMYTLLKRACYAYIIDTPCICYTDVTDTIDMFWTRGVYFINTRLLCVRYRHALCML